MSKKKRLANDCLSVQILSRQKNTHIKSDRLLVVLRKRRPLTPAKVRSLLLAGTELPELSPTNEDAVARAIQQVRRRSRP